MNQKNSLKNTLFLGGDSLKVPKCIFCKNFIDDKDETIMTCKACPEGIPSDVMWESDEKECSEGIKFEEE